MKQAVKWMACAPVAAFAAAAALSSCATGKTVTTKEPDERFWSAWEQRKASEKRKPNGKHDARRVPAMNEDLTLANVFLAHADPTTFEPGDTQYFFPVAARNFYGYSPIQGVRIQVSENCRNGISVVRAGEPRAWTYTLMCAPGGDKSRAFAITTASGSLQDDDGMTFYDVGTSFTWTAGVTLTKVNAQLYRLEIPTP